MSPILMRPTEHSPVCAFPVTTEPLSGKKLMSACGVWMSYYHHTKRIEPEMHAAKHDRCPLCAEGRKVLAAESKTQYAGRRHARRKHLPQ